MLKDFSSWKEYEGASEGSGRSEKIWLVNPDNGDIGLFKFPKTEFTTEHLSEKIAADIATLINVKCMKVDLGVYDSRVGSLDYKINRENENLIEGIRLINKYYPHFNEEILYDSERDEYYSLEMILKSLSKYNFQRDFLLIPIFDFLIGNTDRHQSNWAILQEDKGYNLCLVYDNGSSLCCYVPESQLDSYLGNDKRRFQSLVDTKSKSRIRIDKNLKKEPTHLQVLEFLRVNYFNDVIDLVMTIKDKIDEYNLDILLDEYSNFMSIKRTILIKKFLLEKVKLMSEQFDL
ncbi:protein kinase [Desulfitobacterium sp.]|uniref:protein kinase n=1 Tax=Desulfitobacterium sp. TaxID=49981 RepID=UPI002CA31BE2|nr:protein kinase [Desulfitobacterium sp.]HVJ50603.1 protein kinase [Desulfitobacterium sp.]